MIDPVTQRTLAPQQTASIHLLIPVQSMRTEFPQALAELSAVLQQQGIPPLGPFFAHHLRRPTDTFDFSVCIPIERSIEANGRVASVGLPALTVMHTTYHGDYAGLPHAWEAFIERVHSSAAALRGDFLETYTLGPRESADPATWRTELSVILAAAAGDRA